MNAHRRFPSAMTLVEVMVTVVMVAIVGLGVIAGVTYGLYSQQSLHERNGATRIAAEELEAVKRKLFHTLEPYTREPLTDAELLARRIALNDPADPNLVYDNGTFDVHDNGTPGNLADDWITNVPSGYSGDQLPNRADSVMGTVEMRFFDLAGSEVGISGSPIPLDRSAIRAECTVTWVSPTRTRGGAQSVTMSTIIAPP